MVAVTSGLLDTSVFIAREARRRLDVAALPDESAVSVVTVAELRLGVLQAEDDLTRSMEGNDSWIAATAIAYGMAVITRDQGFPDGLAGLTVIQV